MSPILFVQEIRQSTDVCVLSNQQNGVVVGEAGDGAHRTEEGNAMMLGPALMHDLASDIQAERTVVCTETTNATLNGSHAVSIRRAVGARLISFGEWITGSVSIPATPGAH